MFKKIANASSWVAGGVSKVRGFRDIAAPDRRSLRDDLDILEALLDAHETDLRIAIVGRASTSIEGLLAELAGTPGDDFKVREAIGRGRWYRHTWRSGSLHVLDARSDTGEPRLKALDYRAPDVIIAVVESNEADPSIEVEALRETLEATRAIWGVSPVVTASIIEDEAARSADVFRTNQALKSLWADGGGEALSIGWLAKSGSLVRSLHNELPAAQRFLLARVAPSKELKRQNVERLIQISASITAAMATTPIPIGTTIPITGTQIFMLGGIAFVSGRDASIRTLGEFLAAMGINVGAGLALRELARAIAQFVPLAGSIVSASIAAGATMALGEAATRYFIDKSDE